MLRLARVFATAAVGVALALPLAAKADTAQDYNLFVLGDLASHSSSIQGRVAVKGDAILGSYSVASAAPGGAVNFVVGGSLTAQSGSTNGQTIVGGSSSYTSWSTAGLQPAGTALPVDFADEVVRIGQLSTVLKGYGATGTVSSTPWGQSTLTGALDGLNVFDFDGGLLSGTNSLTINLAPGSTALINVSGAADTFSNAGINIIGGDASSVLWNFYDATSLSFSSVNMLGSVLAPNATYLGGWGQVTGQMIVKEFTDGRGATTLNNVFYKGSQLGLDPRDREIGGGDIGDGGVPEPATWMTLILGFGLTGAALRRRRATPALVPVRARARRRPQRKL